MTATMFSKILIANRGEIACRIMRTCKRLNVRTVAVYSDADANSLHVRSADEAVALGGTTARESYLSIDKMIAAARTTDAQAIHPGYGFLSENDAFAEACALAGIVFIGPPPGAIRAMGSKSSAKALMQRAGVPLVPGYHGEDQQPEHLMGEAAKIGYPVLIKASAGGGGKGMRRVDDAKDFPASLAACRREASAAFGDDHVLIEQYVLRPRHIEVQVFADALGGIVSLYERDCSVQRRHQKVLEEAPAPGMTAERREAMGRAACDAARAVGYLGAGTVEFIADAKGDFHFMEMNTRLQVEHPVTEMITGLDLVEWQLRIAAGEPLPLRQEEVRIHGHSLEARLYAEDPAHDFRPSTGTLAHVRMPQPSTHVRVDAGVEQGDEITPFYDPMIAKLIVWDETREAALARMDRALGEIQIVGVSTNAQFLKRLVSSPSFTQADLDTALIEREAHWLADTRESSLEMGCVLAALAVLLPQSPAGSSSPWGLWDGWRNSRILKRDLTFMQEERRWHAVARYGAHEFTLQIGKNIYCAHGDWLGGVDLKATVNGVQLLASVLEWKGMYHVYLRGEEYAFRWMNPLAFEDSETADESSLLAPIPGLLRALLVKPGVRVEKGTPLLVLEAMKMEYTIAAPAAGRVHTFFFAAGDQVAEGTQLLQFDPDSGEGS